MKANHQQLNAVLLIAAISGSIISLTGCAANDTGKYQEIPVTSNPSGALVTADTGETTITPGKFYLTRDKHHTLVAKYPGFKSQKLTLHNEAQGLALGNAVTLGLLDFVTDCSGGSKFELTPKEVHFNFVKPVTQTDLEAKPQIQSQTPQDSNDNFVLPLAQTDIEAKPQIQSQTPQDSNDNFVIPVAQTDLEAKPQIQSQTPQDNNDNFVIPVAQTVLEAKPQIQSQTPQDNNDNFVIPVAQADLEVKPQIQSQTPQDVNDNIDFTPICSICGRKLVQKDGLHIYRLKLACPKCFKKVTK